MKLLQDIIDNQNIDKGLKICDLGTYHNVFDDKNRNNIQMIIENRQERSSFRKRPRPSGGKLDKIETNHKGNFQEYHALRYQEFETLKITNDKKSYRQTDVKFVSDLQTIVKINQNIFDLLQNGKQPSTLTSQQCEQINYRGNLHRQANIVNRSTLTKFELTDEAYRCLCGCKRARGDKMPICCDLNQLDVLGSGVILFFLFQKGIVANMLVAVLMFGIFATLANLYGGNGPSILDNCMDTKCIFLNDSSARNNLDDYLTNIEYILGMVLCLVWVFTLRFIRYYGRRKNKLLDQHLNSSADYAIKLSNLPHGEYCEKDLIEYLQSLWEKDGKQGTKCNNIDVTEPTNGYGLKSIQIIYNMQFCRKLIEKIKLGCCEANQLIISKKNSNEYLVDISNCQKYKQIKGNLIQNYELLNDLRKKFLNDNQFRKKISTSCCIIQFKDEKTQKDVLQKYGKEKIGFLKQIQAKFYKIFCPQAKNIIFRGKVVVIERAPQPSDIIWLNCQKQSSTLRMLVIYLITLGIIIVSFGLLLGLQFLNYYILKENNNVANLQTQAISLLTTVALQVVNKVLWLVLYFLLDIQYNYTLTNKIVSLMNKALFATCVNILILPMIVYIVIKDDLYGANGLVGFVFNYHITTITAGLALRFFNPVDLLKQLGFNIKPIRNAIFRFLRKSYEKREEEAFMQKINELYEGEYFDVAEAYIFVLTNIFHASFFCHLSPPILFFALAEVFVYYWINKVKLLRLFKIPEITQILVFDTALSQAGIVPIIYGLGSFYLTYVQQGMKQIYDFTLVFQMVAIFFGLLSFFNPGDILNILMEKMLYAIHFIQEEKQKKSEDQQSSNQLVSRGVNNLDPVIENKKAEEEKVDRLENYYNNSNSLKLLGFEQALKGKDQNQVNNELKYFCQGFFNDSEVIADIINQIKAKTIAQMPKSERDSNGQDNDGGNSSIEAN